MFRLDLRQPFTDVRSLACHDRRWVVAGFVPVQSIERIICLAPRHSPSSKPEEKARRPSFDFQHAVDQPNKEIADVTRSRSFNDEPPLIVVWIAEEPNTTAADSDTLSKG